jgi:GT2 family glycosyltransferase
VSAPVRVAVVIVSYETREGLLAGLAALARDAGPGVEIVVVDNASSDGSAAAVRTAFPAVRLIASSENVGFARACNQGAHASTAPLVLFLNPDASLTPGALPTLERLFAERPRLGALGPRTRSPNGDIQVSTGPDLSLIAEWRQRQLVLGVARRERRALAAAEARHAHEHEVDWVSGSCLLVRREAFLAVDGFDERFFLYEEDADLCRRLRAAGFQVLFTPEAEALHALGLSMAKAPGRARLEYHRSHLIYYETHNGRAERAVLRALLAGRSIGGLARSFVARDRAGRDEALALLSLALGRARR